MCQEWSHEDAAMWLFQYLFNACKRAWHIAHLSSILKQPKKVVQEEILNSSLQVTNSLLETYATNYIIAKTENFEEFLTETTWHVLIRACLNLVFERIALSERLW